MKAGKKAGGSEELGGASGIDLTVAEPSRAPHRKPGRTPGAGGVGGRCPVRMGSGELSVQVQKGGHRNKDTG